MSVNQEENQGPGNFVQGGARLSFGVTQAKQPRTKNRRVKHVSEPHIEEYKVNGKTYYRYRHGISSPVHLGTADAILKAVQETKKASARPGGSSRG